MNFSRIAALIFTGLLLDPIAAQATIISLPNNGGTCEGNVTNGLLNGKANCQYANKDRYIGDFANGQFSGMILPDRTPTI